MAYDLLPTGANERLFPPEDSERPELAYFDQFAFVDQYRIYDSAVRQWLWEIRDPRINRGLPIPVVHATPDRAFASYRELLLAQEQRRRLADGRQPTIKDVSFRLRRQQPERNPPLPLWSYHRQDENLDRTRWNRMTLRKLGFVVRRPDNSIIKKGDPDYQTAIYQAPFPLPLSFPYQIEIWTRNQVTANLIRQQLHLRYDEGQVYFRLDFSPVHAVYGCKLVRMSIDGIANNSDLEPGEPGDRVVRYTVSTTIHGWLWRPVREIPTVLSTVFDIDLDDDEVTDETFTVELTEDDGEEA